MTSYPRPTCPECGSVDVKVTSKTGKCNRCNTLRPAGDFHAFSPKIFPEDGRPRDGFGNCHILPTPTE